MDFVYSDIGLGGEGKTSAATAFSAVQSIVEEEICHRPGNPAFRSLCAVLNHHFGQWERLIIIERIGFVEHEYGYVVVALTRDGAKCVTNLERKSHYRDLADGRHPYVLTVEPGRLKQSLSEIDKARQVLSERLLWFDAVDWPLYVLHDVRANGSAFSFGICGWGDKPAEGGHPPQVKMDYAQAAGIMNRTESWLAVPDGSAQAKQLRLAGRTYAALLAMVWQGILGKPDFHILGQDGPMAAESTGARLPSQQQSR